MTENSSDVLESVRTGVELCRKGRWQQGYRTLCQVANADRPGTKLPSVFYSYLGFGMARYEKRFEDGEKLCQRAIEIEFFEPENYVNLARIYGLRGQRKQAVDALRKGLQIDASHQQLRDMMLELGVRKKPVLSFLARDHLVNRMLGRIRHDMASSSKKKRRNGLEDDD
jgi:tetratricopeptide (TPR) repeat protein